MSEATITDDAADTLDGDHPAAVLWDMDGTLVDTEPYWIAEERALVELHGGVWTDEHAYQLVGNDLMVSAQYILDHAPVPLTPVEVVHELLAGVVRRVSRHVPWRPGARELLEALGEAGVPCALVTMSWRSLADVFVASLPAGTFAAVITGDEVTHGKPHPEP
jgi:beta-phosphoglucomutase-like phosphatase (HAD superfamily)